jgi:hypothetical protein
MESLERLLRRCAKRAGARWWAGKTPEVREGQIAKAVAGQLSYPTSPGDIFAENGMVHLTRAQAAHVLAVAATTSLAYGEPRPRQSYITEAADALRDLASDARYLSNGLWDPATALEWTPLTSATFDCGLIGYDPANAFIFWVEEED